MIGKGYKMNIFKKVKKQNGRRQIYFCGIKVFSYKRNRKKESGTISKSAVFKIHGKIQIASSAEIKEGVILQNGSGQIIKIGNYTQLNPYVVLYGGNISIADNCMIGPHVMIVTADHDFIQTEKPMRFAGSINSGDLEIQEDVWIGANATICSGCHKIGKGAVIGANSVVKNDIPDYAVSVGIPAKVIKYRK